MDPVAGFRFAAARAGIKRADALDVGLAVADAPASVAAVLTRNLVRAAPVELVAERVRSGLARAILVNSGCANACTGEAGLSAALRSTQAVAQSLGIDPAEVLPASTGVIGALLPAERIEAVSAELVAKLSPDGFEAFADAIRTTDRWPKLAQLRFATPSGDATLLGIAKGAGMIHPDMALLPHATMLAFLFTDAAAEPAELAAALACAADRTFNSVSVDGDTSTNDCAILMASGASGRSVRASDLEQPLIEVCSRLARSMAADGEGSHHAVEIRAVGLRTDTEARQIARTVATSLLVKTALHGKDANWGRLLAAAGRAGVMFDPSRAEVCIGGVTVASRGVAVGPEAERRAAEAMREPAYVIELRLGDGPGSWTYFGCDLGHGYVDVNAGYRS